MPHRSAARLTLLLLLLAGALAPASQAANYTIPADNPFVGVAGKDAIWSYGLRNPWRCSFDSSTGHLWCGDVGQELYEEIDHVATGRGVNFGWRKLEGLHYYNWSGYTSGALCAGTCFTLPVAEYSHGSFGGGNCAVTGGYVSRRPGAALYGDYIFGDYCSGRVWSMSAGGGSMTLLDDTNYLISSFGEGNDGKLYLVDLGGSIYRLTDS
jgi:glucose/sorbosone dehydrogenase